MENLQGKLAEIADLRRQNRELRNKLRPPRSHRILDRAALDAKLLLQHHAAGSATSRAWMGEVGLSERRWTWAMGLLRYCHMAYRYGVGRHGLKPFDPNPLTMVEELQSAEKIIDAEVQNLKEFGSDNLSELRQHMPRKYWVIE